MASKGQRNSIDTEFKKGVRNSPNTEFQKGHIPFNKGKKQVDYMSPESIKRTAKTRFKKGFTPHNTRRIGDERLDRDGYLYVKVSEGLRPSRRNWKMKHRLIYETHNGEIPEGYVVIFLDQNKNNYDIDNLYACSRKVFSYMGRKSLWTNDPEINKANLLISELYCSIEDKTKK